MPHLTMSRVLVAAFGLSLCCVNGDALIVRAQSKAAPAAPKLTYAFELHATVDRWLLRTAGRRRWLNGVGTFAHNVADADDFMISVGAAGPDWHLGSVVYEIFPDRYASSGAAYDAPEWAVRRDWDALPEGRWNSQYEWFGGDLPGIVERIGRRDRMQDGNTIRF